MMKPYRSATRTGAEFRKGMRRSVAGLVMAGLPMFVYGINLKGHTNRDRMCRLPNEQDRT